MNLTWYLNRLEKMSLAEMFKRFSEQIGIYHSRVKYRDPTQWPYRRFARNGISLTLHSLPSAPVTNDWAHYRIYNFEFDLTKPLEWDFSEDDSAQWPACHYARINYRPGNPYGDVRINWELSRLQFLPGMAAAHQDLAKKILVAWLDKNPYLHGPAYLASMEVALRWFSIYWGVCLFEDPLEKPLHDSIAGLAVASGKFIERRLSIERCRNHSKRINFLSNL